MTTFNDIVRIKLLEHCQAVLAAENFQSPAQRATWITYRDALQDIDVSIENPIFPVQPDEPTFPLGAPQVSLRTEIETNLQTIASQYQAAIDRLTQIENSGTIPFTQAGFNQVVQAVKDEAKYIRLIAQGIKRLIT